MNEMLDQQCGDCLQGEHCYSNKCSCCGSAKAEASVGGAGGPGGTGGSAVVTTGAAGTAGISGGGGAGGPAGSYPGVGGSRNFSPPDNEEHNGGGFVGELIAVVTALALWGLLIKVLIYGS